MLGSISPTLSLRAYRLARRERPARNVALHYNELSTNVTVNHQRYFKYEVGGEIFGPDTHRERPLRTAPRPSVIAVPFLPRFLPL